MKIVALVCNIILFAFTCLVLATDGLPTEPRYVFSAIWSLVTMILSALVILRMGTRYGWLGLHGKEKGLGEQGNRVVRSYPDTILRIVAIIGNIVFFGLVGWALVDQYPHPKEPGFIPFVVVQVLTPILNLIVVGFSQWSAQRPTRPEFSSQ